MNKYIFADNAEETERNRLRMIETAIDPSTIALLSRIPIANGWRCLELGAGAGSILRWLGDRVGKTAWP